MVEAEIFREPTEQERKDFIDIRSAGTMYKTFKTKLEAVEQDFLHKHKKPFCFRCAKLDFEDLLETAKKELGRLQGDARAKKQVQLVNTKDWTVYGRADRFALLGESPAMDRVRVGEKTEVRQVGTYKNYECRERGCGVSILIPTNEEKA